ncbi:MAG: hypothetical protein ACODAD_11240 [Planctomycetota bacterium]
MTSSRGLKPVRCFVVSLSILSSLTAASWCQDAQWLPRRKPHAWARFPVGAWKRVRVHNATFDDNEQLVRSSTMITRTRVTRLGRRSFSLSVSTIVNAAGQQFASEPQVITKELAPEVVSSEVLRTDTVTINDRQYPVEVIELVTKNGATRETSTLYYSPGTTPSILKRTTSSTDTESSEAKTSTVVKVNELNKNRIVLGETLCTWSVTTTIKKPSRTVTIREIHSEDIPGEVVSQVIEERDADGTLASRKEVELLGYGRGRRRLFQRRR